MSAALGLVFSGGGVLLDIANQVMTLCAFAILFAGLFRYLPEKRLPVGQALVGGVVASALFTIGKTVIALYLSHGNVGGAYGAAGSLVIVIVWVYYSAMIFFFGAEFTHVMDAGRRSDWPKSV